MLKDGSLRFTCKKENKSPGEKSHVFPQMEKIKITLRNLESLAWQNLFHQHKHSRENYLKHLKNWSSPEINVLTCSSGLHLTLYLNCMCECPHLIWVCWLLDQDWLPYDLWCHKLFTLAAINVSNSAHTSVNTARLKHPTVRAGRKTHLWLEGRLSNIRIQQGSVHVSFLNGDYSLTTITLTVSAAQLKLPFSYKSMKSDARGWTGYYGLSFCTNFLHSWHPTEYLKCD